MTWCRRRMPEGLDIKPDGMHSLDPCVYQDKQVFRNVTVTISQCVRCGHVSIFWTRQHDTETLQYEPLDEETATRTGDDET